MADQAGPAAQSDPRPCPICGKPASHAEAPFCSRRCADVDLHRWLGGVYAVPVREELDDGERPPRSPDED